MKKYYLNQKRMKKQIIFLHFKIKANEKILSELEKNEKIDKNLLRYLTVKVKKFDLKTEYFNKKDGSEVEKFKNKK